MAVRRGLIVCGIAVVVPSRLQVVRVRGVASCFRAEEVNKYDKRKPMSSFIVWCHFAASDVAPSGVNKENGSLLYLLTWAGHDLITVSVVVALWRVLDGHGGWVASTMVVVGRKKRRGNV